MTDWTQNAIGIYVDDTSLLPAELGNYDFVVAKTGDKFHGYVQAAHDLGIPCILFADHKISKWHVDYGLNPAIWPPAEQEELIQHLDQMIYSGGVKRAIHGIMLDCSYVYDDQDAPALLTYNWYVERTRWMLDMVWQRYKLPIYMYQSRQPIQAWTGDGKEAVIKLLKDYGVSTVSFTVTDDKYPHGDQKPYLPYDGGAEWKWYFWLFGKSPLTMLYNGTPAKLYGELEYTPSGVVPPDDDEWPVDDDDIPDNWDMPTAVDDVITAIDYLEHYLTNWMKQTETRLALLEEVAGDVDKATLARVVQWIRGANNI